MRLHQNPRAEILDARVARYQRTRAHGRRERWAAQWPSDGSRAPGGTMVPPGGHTSILEHLSAVSAAAAP